MTLKIQPRDRGLIYACIDAQGTGFDTVKSDTACPTTKIYENPPEWPGPPRSDEMGGPTCTGIFIFTYLESLALTRNLPSSKRTVAETGHPDRSAGRALRV
jgi:hypothetical protein